ncbi:MAG: hypothetical protein JHC31_05880 [Sulfurihydrogenibium sp.]|jgi:type II secretory pathway component GspD/PulD (secretin)|nr:hypothetical protein [Sulfurihydrogenibium sp.]
MKFIKRIGLSVIIASLLGGCSSMIEKYQTPEEEFRDGSASSKESLKIIGQRYDSISNEVNISDFNYQKIIIEKDDIDPKFANDLIDIKSTSLTFGEFINEIANMKKMGVVVNVKPEILNSFVSLDFKNVPMKDMIKSVELMMDVDIIIHANTIYVSENIAIQGAFTAMQTKEVKTYENLEKYLKQILGKDSNVIVDPITGSYLVEDRANKIRRTKDLIESVINEASGSLFIRLDIYKVDNQKASELGLSFNSMVDALYQINNGAKVENSILNMAIDYKTFKGVDANGNPLTNSSLLFAIKALESAKLLNYVSSPSLTLFNGVESKLEDTREVGDWLPGRYTRNQTYGVGYSNLDNHFNRPEFDKFEVGNIIKMTPKINQKEKLAHVKIEFEDSKVYDVRTTTYKQSPELEAQTITKSLKSKNSINTLVTLNDGQYSIISGLRQQLGNVERLNIPGTEGSVLQGMGDNKDKSEFHDVLMVARPFFPKNTKIIEVLNKKPF